MGRRKLEVKKDPKPLSGVQSIHRAISLLRTVAEYNTGGVRLSKIAEKLGLHPTTAHRILSVLVSEGLVMQDSHSKLYHLGFELYVLGTTAQQFSLRDRFHSTLERIAAKTGDTAYLVIPSGNDALCLDRVVGKFPIQVLTFEIGERRPLGIGAGSLAILASLPDDQVETIIHANKSRYSNYSNKGAEDVRSFVIQSRKLGYGLSDRVVTAETIGVGVTVKDRDGIVVAALSVAGIVKRMSPVRQKEIVKLIKSEMNTVKFSSHYISSRKRSPHTE